MHLMARRERTVICSFFNSGKSENWKEKLSTEKAWHAREKFWLFGGRNLCIQNIVSREFMIMVDYNENDYLYLPKP